MTQVVPFEWEQALTAIDMAIDPVILFEAMRDADGRIVDFEYRYLNQAASTMLAGTGMELVGERLLAVFPSVAGMGLFERAERALERREGDRFEIRDFHEHGVDLGLEVNLVPIGEQLLVSCRDHSSQWAAEAALRDSEARFRSLIQHSGDMVLVLDAEGVITYASPAVERVLGYEPHAVLGQSAFDFVHPEDVAIALDSMVEMLARPGVAPPTTYRARHADGSWRWVEDVANNLLEDPLVAGIVLTLRDITGQRQTTEALAELNRVLRTVTDADAAVVRATSESDLLVDMCRVVVDTGGYPMAFIAGRDPTTPGRAIPVQGFGSVADFFGQVLDASPGPVERGPATEALATGRTVHVADLAELPAGLPIREVSLRFGYRSQLALPLVVDGEVAYALSIHSEEAGAFDIDEIALFEQLATNLAFGIASLRTAAERQQYSDRLEHNLDGLVTTVAAMVEQRDPYTAGHQHRVADLAAAIARELGLSDDEVAGIEMAARIHDIGKIAVPSEILTKPGRLTPLEFELIKQHVEVGRDMVQHIDFPWPVARMIGEHHERLDGSGYPQALIGDAIYVGSRVLAVADVVEAMVTHRPYRPGKGIDVALAQITEERGTRLDAAAVDACLRLFRGGRVSLTDP